MSLPGIDLEAVYWDSAGVHRMYAPNNLIQMEAANDDGTIALGLAFPQSYVWREGMGFRSLNQILLNDFGVVLPTVWPLAWGLSSDGRTIAGYYQNSDTGGRDGFLVHLPHSIPAPGAGALACVALGALARRHRR